AKTAQITTIEATAELRAFVSVKLKQLWLNQVNHPLDFVLRRINKQRNDIDHGRKCTAQFASALRRDIPRTLGIENQSDGIGACISRRLGVFGSGQSANFDSSASVHGFLVQQIPKCVAHSSRTPVSGKA